MKINFSINKEINFIEISVRVVIIGKTEVGKTSIIYRYIKNYFQNNLESTIGVSVFPRVIQENNKKIIINYCDTAGQEKYRSLGSLYYRDSIAAIIVFDLTNRESFEQISSWVDEYKSFSSNPFIFFAANKNDLKENIVINENELLDLSQKYDTDCILTSAIDGTGINELFTIVSTKIFECAKEKWENDENLLKIKRNLNKKEENYCC